jgi:tryptophan-rich sensory protein
MDVAVILIRVPHLTLPVVAAILIVILMLAVGGRTTTVGAWYEDLRKPPWNPPNWLFGPAWTAILALAAWSGVLAWMNATDEAGRILILSLFASNIVLHMLWSPLFFALKRPDWALAEVLFLWLSIVALMFGVGRYSTLAIWLLLPYLLWVTFAAVLNLQIVRLNQPFRARVRN